MRFRRSRAVVSLIAALVIVAMMAVAAVATETVVQPGGIRPAAEPLDCYGTAAANCSSVAGLRFINAVEFTSDGKMAYVGQAGLSSPNSIPYGGIATFDVSPTTGAFTQKAAPDNCLWFDTTDAPHANEAGCTVLTDVSGNALGQIDDIELSPDDKFLYAAARSTTAGHGGLYWFERDTTGGSTNGRLTFAGCASVGAVGGCAFNAGANINGARSLAISPDGANLYLAADVSDAVTTFARNTTTGALMAQVGCHEVTGSPGTCTEARGLSNPATVLVSANGAKVYVSAYTSDAVATFDRDSGTGALTQVAGTAGCTSETGEDFPGVGAGDCADGRGLDDADGMTMSPDQKSIYVTSANGNSIALFDIDGSGNAVQLAGAEGCLSASNVDCTAIDASSGVDSVVVSKDNRSVYVTADTPASVLGFNRTPGATALTRATDPSMCLQSSAVIANCTAATAGTFAFGGASNLSLHPNGHFLIFTSFPQATFSVVVRPGSAPSCSVSAITTAGDAAATTPTCTDLDGDALTFSIGAGPSNGTLSAIDASTGAVSYSPNSEFAGADSFTIVAADTFHSTTMTVGVTATAAGGGTTVDKTRPVLKQLRLTPAKFRVGPKRGTRIRYSLSEAARVRVVLERRVGRKWKRIRGSQSYALGRAGGKAGANTVRFRGIWNRKRLAPGKYRFTFTATDAAKNTTLRPVRVVGVSLG